MGRKGEQARAKMIQESLKLISKHGFHETSFQMVANACGLSQGAPLYHFKNKEGLFTAIIKSIQLRREKMIRDSVEPKDDAFERLLKYFESNLNWAHIYRTEAEVFLLLHYYSTLNKNFAQHYIEIVRSDLEYLESLLLSGQRELLLQKEMNLDESGHFIFDTLIGSMVNSLATGGEFKNIRDIRMEDIRLRLIKILNLKVN